MSMTRVVAIAALLASSVATGAGAQDQPAAADQAKTETLEAAVRTLTAETSSQRSQLASLQAELAARDAAVEAARADVAARDRRIQELTQQAAALPARAQQLETDLAAARASAAAEAEARRAQSDQAEAVAATAAGLDLRLQEAEAALGERDALIERARVELLAARNDLGSAEAQLAVRDRQIAALVAAGRELVAGGEQLAAQNRELTQQAERVGGYRQAFFDRLRQELGPDADKLLEGNRFVFPTDVAFESGSARLTPRARAQALALGREIAAAAAAAIPAGTDWVIRVDGHTDRQAVGGRSYRSNRDLGASRAIEVVEVLTEAGVPPERLLPASFGEFRPLQPGDTPEAHRANRRIELHLDQD
jgi:chemotaxis protein MotB